MSQRNPHEADSGAHWLVKIVFWALWAAATTVISSTILWEFSRGQGAYLVWAFVALVLLFVLYHTEGLELAAADLNDKDVSTLSRSIRRVVEEIHSRHELFISQRQLLSVLIISFLALLMERGLKRLYVPYCGIVIDNEYVLTATIFVFINLTVLWFCQISPKRLASRNSELFLERSKSVWPLIKAMGFLRIDSPSDEITEVSAALMKVTPRLLPPSRASLYNLGTRINGLSVDRTSLSLTLENGGAAKIRRVYLLLFAHGRHQSIPGRMTWGGPTSAINLADVKVEVVDFVTLQVVEDLREYADYLDKSFADGKFELDSRAARPTGDDDLSYHIHMEQGARPNVVIWKIRLAHAVPERYWGDAPDALEDDDRVRKFVAILYTVEASAPPGSFYTEGADFWAEDFVSAPCRRFDVAIRAAATGQKVSLLPIAVTSAHLNSDLSEENRRCNRSFDAQHCIRYPMPGSVLRFNWEMMSVQAVGTRPSVNAAPAAAPAVGESAVKPSPP